MKQLTLFIFIYISSTIYADDYNTLMKDAYKLYSDKEYKQSLEKYISAFKIKSDNDYDLYNGACIAALANNKKLALKWLGRSVQLGWIDIEHTKKDEDLTILHNSKKWKKILSNMQQMKDKIEANYNMPLKLKLDTILQKDQGVRFEWNKIQKEYGMESKQADSIIKVMHNTDSLNLIEIKNILDNYGWLGADKIGKDGNMTLFLVIQHSDLTTQKKYLPMMREAVKNNNAKGSSLALLEDRIANREKKPQIYGSQIGYDKTTKSYYILLLDDPDNVDNRRKEVGLGKLEDYVKNWDIIWNVEEYKKQIPELKERLEKEN